MISSVTGRKTLSLVWGRTHWLVESSSGDLEPVDHTLQDIFEGEGNPGEVTLYLGNDSGHDFDARVSSNGGSVDPTGPQTVAASMDNTPKWTLRLPPGHDGEVSFSILPNKPKTASGGDGTEPVSGTPPDPTIKVNWSTGRG